jgi:putative MFS transporter
VATYVPELFPTRLRLRGAGLSNTVGRAVSIGIPYAVAASFMRFGIAGVLTLIVGTLLAQALIVALIGTETKRRSLEAIEQEVGSAAPETIEGGAAEAVR